MLKIANQATKITRVEKEYGNIVSLIAARIRPDEVRIKFIDACADNQIGDVWPRETHKVLAQCRHDLPPAKHSLGPRFNHNP